MLIKEVDPVNQTQKSSQNTSTDTSKTVCTICYKNKAAYMIVCVKCNQWLHCCCLGMKIKDAEKIKRTFHCKKCEEIGE